MRSFALVVTLALLLPGCAARTGGPAAAGGGLPASEKRFPDPKAAVDALLDACRADDEAALIAIFGAEAKPLVSMEDGGANRERCRLLVAAAKQSTRLDPAGPDTLRLAVGSDDWPFAIPLVRDAGGWRFDTQQGLEEVVRRRIGADEIEAIRVARAYVRAQEEFARGAGAGAYAQRLVSTQGKRDGLYWPSTGKGDESPLGPLVASAGDSVAGKAPARSWWGYHFRILTAQGAGAPGGAQKYLADGRMVGGFAMIASPVAYGRSGIMTFIVSRDGFVFQKDLGEKTEALAAAMKSYDPGAGWTLAAD